MSWWPQRRAASRRSQSSPRAVRREYPAATRPQHQWRPADTPVADYVARASRAARDRRPAKALEAAEQQVKAARAVPPTVGLQAGTQYRRRRLATPDGWTFGLGAQYDIYMGENGNMTCWRRPVTSLEHSSPIRTPRRTRRDPGHISIRTRWPRWKARNVTLAQEGLGSNCGSRKASARNEILDAEPPSPAPVFVPGLAEYAVANAALERYGEQLVAARRITQALPAPEDARPDGDGGNG